MFLETITGSDFLDQCYIKLRNVTDLAVLSDLRSVIDELLDRNKFKKDITYTPLNKTHKDLCR